MKNLIDRPDIVAVILEALEVWCIHYKLTGSPSETPRYSQIMSMYWTTGLDEDDDYILRSTQKALWYPLNFNQEQKQFLRDLELEVIKGHTTKLWDQYKRLRTDYLRENHPTISVY